MTAMRAILFALLICATAAHAAESPFPQRPIRLISPSQAAGANDVIARIMAARLGEALNVQVVVDNRGAAGGMIGADLVAKSAPDGYSLLFYSNGLWTLPLLQKAPFDPLKDFAPVTLAVTSPSILVAHPSLPVKSVRELLALARARRGELNYASGGNGAPTHLAAELFKLMAGARAHRILCGTPKSIADSMQEWFESGACDGFNVMFPYLPGGLDDFVNLVVPELQRRGLFRTEYEGRTLRENLGLPRPENRFFATKAKAAE